MRTVVYTTAALVILGILAYYHSRTELSGDEGPGTPMVRLCYKLQRAIEYQQLALLDQGDILKGQPALDQIIRRIKGTKDFQKFLQQPEIRRYWRGDHFVDRWEHRLKSRYHKDSLVIYSAGPNGIDEGGNGDDIPHVGY
jgi:hypothetical protein